MHPEDPRLTAHVLNELGVEEAAAIDRAIAEDPALKAEVRETARMSALLAEALELHPVKLPPHLREQIRHRAVEASRKRRILTVQRWIIPAAAAAVLAMTTLILLRMPGVEPAQVAAQKQKVPDPVPPPNTLPSPSALPAENEATALESISKSIRTDGKLPAPESVQTAGLLNAFALRLNGMTAIARNPATAWHPDSRDDGISGHVATLTTEMIPCPWRPSATLLIISLRGNSQNASDIGIVYQPDTTGVARHRLIGRSLSGNVWTTSLAVDATATLAIEIEPSKPGGNLGSLVWTTNGKPAPPVTLTRKLDVELSDDARFGALVCTFGQWLEGGQSETIDADIVAALAREVASTTLSPDRADFLNLIDKSLHL